MQLTITGHHVEVTQAIHDYVENKMQHLKRLEDYINSVNVILSVDKLDHKAEAKILVKGSELFADSTAETMYAAIDTLADKLERQLVKYKEKLTQ